MIPADLYLRLSDFRDDSDGFAAREAKLRQEAARLGWTVARVVIENDIAGNGDGKRRGVSAYKRAQSGRVPRTGFASVVADLAAGRASAVLAEDLSRVVRDVRDGEDLLDACEARGASARSLSGTLTLTGGGTGAERMVFRMFLAHLAQESADKAWRVAQGRERGAAAGRYGGGRRPYGYRPDPDAPPHSKTLLVVGEEAAELRHAAGAVLAGVSLRALARDLRDRDVPTVTGARWTPDTLRGCLLKPAVAGLAAHTATVRANGDPPRTVTTLHDASWPAIIGREQWQAVTDKLTDPGRTTNPGTEPRWLCSGIARCGCPVTDKETGEVIREECGELVYVRQAGRRPSYVCRGPRQHLRRSAVHVDEYARLWVCAYLDRDDNRDLLRPAPRPGIDAGKLRTEAAQLAERRKAQMRMHAAGDLDDADLAEGLREIKRRLAVITGTLAAASDPDPLAEFRDQPAAGAVWDGLTLPRQRAVLKLVASVTLLAATRRGRGFDPDSVRVGPAVTP